MIEIKNEFGQLCYFTTELGSDEFKNWICQYIEEDDYQHFLSLLKKHNLNEFTILHNLEVDYENKGKGFGKKILTNFLTKNQSKPIILIAEAYGSNFLKLDEWYGKYGFETISKTIAGPLMIKKN